MISHRFILACLIWLAIVAPAWSAAFTAAASGNWSDDATWTGSGVPGDGDTADWGNYNITVDVNTTVGNSSGIVATGANGNLTVAAGVTFTVKGSINLSNNGGLTCEAGSTLTMADVTAARYIRVLNGTGTTTFNGTEANPCTCQCTSSVANSAYFVRATTNCSRLTATWTNFINMGSSTNTNAFSAPFTVTDCTWTSCGRATVSDIAATDAVDIQRCQWDTGSTSIVDSLALIATVAPSGGAARNIIDCRFGKGINLAGDLTDFIIEDVFADAKCVIGSTTTSGAFNRLKDCMFAGANNTGYWLQMNAPGPVTNSVFVHGNTLHQIDIKNESSGTYECANNWFEIMHNSTGGDSIVGMPATNDAGSVTYSVHNNIVLWGPGESVADTLFNMAAKDTGITLEIDHNTSFGAQTSVMEGTLEAGGVGHTGLLGSFSSNILVCNASATQYALEQFASFRSSDDNVDTGTLTGVTATTFTDSGAAWGTIFTDNPTMRILFTAGAASGESTVITGNSSATVGTVSAWSGATPSTDAYKIFVADIFDPADVDYNCHLNGKATGTIHRFDNTNTTSVQGYDGYYISSGTPGANDLWATDPQFTDDTRNVAAYDTADDGLNNADATAWADTGSTYNVGDFASNSDAAFYGGATVNFRCISSHAPTGVANDEPGVGSAWTTYWEYATVHRMRTDPTQIAALNAWLFGGYSPTNVALQNAGHDSVTIGAVEGDFGNPGSAYYYHQQSKVERDQKDREQFYAALGAATNWGLSP